MALHHQIKPLTLPTREHRDIMGAVNIQMLTRHIGKHRTEIRRHGQIAPIFERIFHQSLWHIPVDLTTSHVIPQHKQTRPAAVVRTQRTVLMHRAAKFRHRHQNHIVLIRAQIRPKRAYGLRQLDSSALE